MRGRTPCELIPVTFIDGNSPEKEGRMAHEREQESLVIGVMLSPYTNLHIDKSTIDTIGWQVPEDNETTLPSLHDIDNGRAPWNDYG